MSEHTPTAIDFGCGCRATPDETGTIWSLTHCNGQAERDRLKAENAELVAVAKNVCNYFDTIGKVRNRGIPDGMYDEVNTHVAAKGGELLRQARAALAKLKGGPS